MDSNNREMDSNKMEMDSNNREVDSNNREEKEQVVLQNPHKEKSQRLLSLDALRGFNMFFIMGGAAFFIILAKCLPNNITQAIAEHMVHADWHGFKHHDMIFPLFLFLAGVSFPYSWAKQKALGKSVSGMNFKIFLRAFLLVLIGIIYGNKVIFDFENMRYASVLGHIGIAWMCAALIFMNTRWFTQVLITISVLIVYWLLLAIVPAPDTNGEEAFTKEAWLYRIQHVLKPDEKITSNFTMEGSIVGYVDRNCLPGRLYNKIFDPEGILSVIPAIITALLGAMAGSILIRPNSESSPWKKVFLLIIIGALLLVAGVCWDNVFPINKKLWTSSFVCFVGGLSYLLLALFYLVIDVWRFRWWCYFFVVIGMNSITIYLAQRIIGFDKANEFFFAGLAKVFSIPEVGTSEEAAGFFKSMFTYFSTPNTHDMIMALGYIAVCWTFLYVLYRYKTFLKI